MSLQKGLLGVKTGLLWKISVLKGLKVKLGISGKNGLELNWIRWVG